MDQRKAIFRAKLCETKEKQQRRIDPALGRSSTDSLSLSICVFDLVLDYLSVSCRLDHSVSGMAATPVQGVTIGHLDEQPTRILASHVQKLAFLFVVFF
jgi:hypothetical protein